MRRWAVITVALVLGFLLLGYDQRTDDSAIEMGLILAASLGLTVSAPRVAIAIALAVGLPMTLLNGSWPGLVIASAGALLGYVMTRGLRPAIPG